MTCKEYQNLSPLERVQFIGKIVHSISSHPETFKMGLRIIEQGENLGLFKNVIINPPGPDELKSERFVG